MGVCVPRADLGSLGKRAIKWVCVCLVLSEETRHSIRVVPVVELAPMAITLLPVDLEMTQKIYTLIDIYVCSKVVRNSFDAISKDYDEACVASRSTTS